VKVNIREIGQRCGAEFCGLDYGPVTGTYEHGNAPSGSIMKFNGVVEQPSAFEEVLSSMELLIPLDRESELSGEQM
jgi:hypothetical protein